MPRSLLELRHKNKELRAQLDEERCKSRISLDGIFDDDAYKIDYCGQCDGTGALSPPEQLAQTTEATLQPPAPLGGSAGRAPPLGVASGQVRRVVAAPADDHTSRARTARAAAAPAAAAAAAAEGTHRL